MLDLAQMAKQYDITLNADMLECFDAYAQLLSEWNEKINLTAIKDADEVKIKHFLDSLLLTKALDIKTNATIIDIGAGAGFPSVPINILRPDIQVTMLDSLNKRIGFLSALSELLGQDNVLIHGRAEEYGRKSEFREQFDIVSARAVATLPALCEFCLPFAKVSGCFAALKGGDVEEEVLSARPAMKALGAELADIAKFTLPDMSKRSIVIIKKISRTIPKYPRAAVKITKSPIL